MDIENQTDYAQLKALKSYSVGALLYVPAIYEAGIVRKIANGNLKSVAFCLEDSIADEAIEEAEVKLKNTLISLRSVEKSKLPMIFIRPRSPKHLERVHKLISGELDLITGYVLPKFDTSNAEEYKQIFLEINRERKTPIYFMPILESKLIACKDTRINQLYKIKEILDSVSDYVLNVRVGGNDFCNLFGVRRKVTQSIYDIGVVRDILVDILNVFSIDYVVSGPVWEYFGTDSKGEWAKGLKHELELDVLNGFMGKTAIHPSQLPIIYNSLMVDKIDFEDAKGVLNWQSNGLGVFSGVGKSRMNEVKCHLKWAKKICLLAEIYGVRE